MKKELTANLQESHEASKWSGFKFFFFVRRGVLYGSIAINGNVVPGISRAGSNKSEIQQALLQAYIEKNAEAAATKEKATIGE